VSGSDYTLDMDWLRLELKDLEDDEAGIAFPDTHSHNTAVTLSGVVYARIVEIINGYTLTITPAFAGTVTCTGANHNLGDVYNNTAGPTLIIGNAAGLVQTAVSGLTSTEAEDLELLRKFHTNDYGTDDSVSPAVIRLLDDDGVTPIKEAPAYEDYDKTQEFRGSGVRRRGTFTDAP
jgi:hypothetical protein